MIIKCKNIQLVIDEESASIGNNNYLSYLTLTENINHFYPFIQNSITPQSDVFIYDYSASNIDLITLYILTLLKCHLFYNEKEYELSFAFAIPICRDDSLREFVNKNFDLCLNNNQIIFLPTESLYQYNSIPHEGLIRILHDERKTIKRNVLTTVEEVGFTDAFFAFWQKFDKNRFGEDQSLDFQNFFRYVYTSMNFRLFKYSACGRLIAYNVCYFSKSQKVIYDVLFPWQNDENAYRIGIFSMIKNMERAAEMGWGYSMCYGIYNYKNAVLDKLKVQ